MKILFLILMATLVPGGTSSRPSRADCEEDGSYQDETDFCKSDCTDECEGSSLPGDLCRMTNEGMDSFHPKSLKENGTCIRMVICQAKSQNATTKTFNDLTSMLQLLSADSAKLASKSVSQIVKFLASVAGTSRPNRVEIEANSSLRHMALIISQLAEGFWNRSSQMRKQAAYTNCANESLQLEIAERFPVMCLKSALARNMSTFELETRSFSLLTSNVDPATIDKVQYRPLIRNNDGDTPISLSIPRSVVTSYDGNPRNISHNSTERRTVFIYYRDDTFFPSKQTAYNILSINIGLNESITLNFSKPISIVHHNVPKAKSYPVPGYPLLVTQTTYECVFWNFTLRNWSSEGCCLNTTSYPPQCLCYHLTNFALLVKSENVPANVALSITSAIGCYLSIFGLLCTILLLVLKKELRKYRSGKILLHLCFSLTASYIVFVAGISNAVGDTVGCAIVTSLLHYLFLLSWCWMCAYSYEMYNSLVKVFVKYHSGFIAKTSVVCYTVPFVVVSLTAGIALGIPASQPDQRICGSPDISSVTNYYAANVCWLKGPALYAGFLTPVAILLLFNLVVFVLVSLELKKQNNKVAHIKRSLSDSLIIAVTMTFMMGLTWIFGFLMLVSSDEVYYSVMSWLFAIFNTLQGFGIFLITSIRREDMRSAWFAPILKKFRFHKQPKLTVDNPDQSSIEISSKQKKTSTSQLTCDS